MKYDTISNLIQERTERKERLIQNLKTEAAEKYSKFSVASKLIHVKDSVQEKPITPNPAHEWVRKNRAQLNKRVRKIEVNPEEDSIMKKA